MSLLVHCASWTHFLVTAQLAHICLTTWRPPVIYVSPCALCVLDAFFGDCQTCTHHNDLSLHLPLVSPCALCLPDAFFGARSTCTCPPTTGLPGFYLSFISPLALCIWDPFSG